MFALYIHRFPLKRYSRSTLNIGIYRPSLRQAIARSCAAHNATLSINVALSLAYYITVTLFHFFVLNRAKCPLYLVSIFDI